MSRTCDFVINKKHKYLHITWSCRNLKIPLCPSLFWNYTSYLGHPIPCYFNILVTILIVTKCANVFYTFKTLFWEGVHHLHSLLKGCKAHTRVRNPFSGAFEKGRSTGFGNWAYVEWGGKGRDSALQLPPLPHFRVSSVVPPALPIHALVQPISSCPLL